MAFQVNEPAESTAGKDCKFAGFNLKVEQLGLGIVIANTDTATQVISARAEPAWESKFQFDRFPGPSRDRFVFEDRVVSVNEG